MYIQVFPSCLYLPIHHICGCIHVGFLLLPRHASFLYVVSYLPSSISPPWGDSYYVVHLSSVECHTIRRLSLLHGVPHLQLFIPPWRASTSAVVFQTFFVRFCGCPPRPPLSRVLRVLMLVVSCSPLRRAASLLCSPLCRAGRVVALRPARPGFCVAWRHG